MAKKNSEFSLKIILHGGTEKIYNIPDVNWLTLLLFDHTKPYKIFISKFYHTCSINTHMAKPYSVML